MLWGLKKKGRQTSPASSYLASAVLSEHKVRAHGDSTQLGLGMDSSESSSTGDGRLAEKGTMCQVRAGRVLMPGPAPPDSCGRPFTIPSAGQGGTSVNSGYIMAMNWELDISSQAKIKGCVLSAGTSEHRGD